MSEPTYTYFVEWRTGDWENPTCSWHVEMTNEQARHLLARLEAVDERLNGELDPLVVPAINPMSYEQFVDEWLLDMEAE